MRYFQILGHIYADVDIRYASTNDLTSMATGRLMSAEIVMNVLAIFMDRQQSRHTLLTVFTSTVMVLWKTAIYLCKPKNTLNKKLCISRPVHFSSSRQS